MWIRRIITNGSKHPNGNKEERWRCCRHGVTTSEQDKRTEIRRAKTEHAGKRPTGEKKRWVKRKQAGEKRGKRKIAFGGKSRTYTKLSTKRILNKYTPFFPHASFTVYKYRRERHAIMFQPQTLAVTIYEHKSMHFSEFKSNKIFDIEFSNNFINIFFASIFM